MIPRLSDNDRGASAINSDDWRLNACQAKAMSQWLAGVPILSIMAGWGAGKTRLLSFICQASHERDPGCSGLIVTDSMGRGARTVGVEMNKLLVDQAGWTYHHTYNGQPSPHYLSPPLDGKRTRVWIMSWTRPSTAHKSANSIEGPDVSFAMLDEANVLSSEGGPECASAMLGRIRSGKTPQLLLVGKPRHGAWWTTYATSRGGYAFRATSYANRRNLKGFDTWIRTLSPSEYRENVLAQPAAPQGSVFTTFSTDSAPDGNLTPPGWTPRSDRRTIIAIDFGVRSPAALGIQRCDDLNADVVIIDCAPDDASVFELCEMLVRGVPGVMPGVWPAYRRDAPPGKMPIHAVVGDRAGAARRDDAVKSSAFSDVLQPPAAGGLGMRVISTSDRKKIDVHGGVMLIQRLILNNSGERRLLIWRDLWNHTIERAGRSLAKSLLGYSWRANSQTFHKDGFHDHHIDALRYWAVNLRSGEDARHLNTAKAAINERKNRVATKRQHKQR